MRKFRHREEEEKKTKELFMDMDYNKPELSFKLNLTY